MIFSSKNSIMKKEEFINMNNKVGTRKWLNFILAGFVGQIAWALENMYLSTYAFYASHDIAFISLMTALSAVTATLTTLLMGALSDKLHKRKAFIAFGYIIWGVSIGVFAFLDPHSDVSIVGNSLFMAGTMIVIMDCVMTFFGSTSNDAAFNAYVTDNTEESYRGKVESVLSVLPMLSMIMIVAIAGVVFNCSVDGGRWDLFFYVIGGITTAIGIALLFVIPKDKEVELSDENYFKNIFYGFRPSVVKANPLLYLCLICFCTFSIAIQVFFPYLIVYIQKTLGIMDMNFIITIGVVLLLSSIVTVIIGLFMDKWGKNKLIIPALAVATVGSILFIFAKDMWFVIISGLILMSGYMVLTALFGAKVRDYTPEGKAGLFQGIRMIFVVMIPMVTGPYIGQGLSYINAVYYTDDYGQQALLPNNLIFLGVAIVLALTFVPVIILLNKERKNASK